MTPTEACKSDSGKYCRCLSLPDLLACLPAWLLIVLVQSTVPSAAK